MDICAGPARAGRAQRCATPGSGQPPRPRPDPERRPGIWRRCAGGTIVQSTWRASWVRGSAGPHGHRRPRQSTLPVHGPDDS